jgi:hypothetical protein
MTWQQRFEALTVLEGDAWDAEHERLEQDWCAAYAAAFVKIAALRGWRRQDDAATWTDQISGEAFMEAYRYNWDPWQAAEADVIACEEPP